MKGEQEQSHHTCKTQEMSEQALFFILYSFILFYFSWAGGTFASSGD